MTNKTEPFVAVVKATHDPFKRPDLKALDAATIKEIAELLLYGIGSGSVKFTGGRTPFSDTQGRAIIDVLADVKPIYRVVSPPTPTWNAPVDVIPSSAEASEVLEYERPAPLPSWTEKDGWAVPARETHYIITNDPNWGGRQIAAQDGFHALGPQWKIVRVVP